MTKKDYIAFVEMIKRMRKDSATYNTANNAVVEVRVVEDYLSLLFAKDNPKFDVSGWRKALGRTDY